MDDLNATNKRTINKVFNTNMHDFDKLLGRQVFKKLLNHLNRMVGTSNNHKEESYYESNCNMIKSKLTKENLEKN